MSLKLYHYVHCPFCVRVRLTLGYLGLKYDSHVLSYNDEQTPVKLSGVKMLPILEYTGGVKNESLDIMETLDKTSLLQIAKERELPEFKQLEAYLNFIGGPIHSLAMPYWIWTPEFNEESRQYFTQKKEAKRGPFKNLVHQREKFIKELQLEWTKIENDLKPFYQSKEFGVRDILLAAHLWGLYIVPEFQFPLKIHQYLQAIGEKCNFNYHQDFWR